MSIDISQLQDELAPMLHGTSLDKVKNLYGAFNRAARDFLLDIDPDTTRRTQALTNALYNKVYDYPVPRDLKGDAVINISTVSDDSTPETFRQVHERKFFLDKEDYTFDVLYNSGLKYATISRALDNSLTINTVDSLTANGAWSVGGDGTDLTLDQINYVAGDASLKYNSTGATGIVTIQNTDMTPVDLTDYEDVGSIFLWQYIPNADLVTSYTLDWGNDVTTNYFSDTVTTPHFGTFVDGYNLIRFDWDGATENGTVDLTAIDSVKLTRTGTSGTTETNLRLDNIIIQTGRLYDMSYYSKFLFQDATTGVWQEEVNDDSNIINLDSSSFSIFLYKVAQHVAAQLNDNKDDVAYFSSLYNDAMSKYRRQFASDKQKKTQSYYNL